MRAYVCNHVIRSCVCVWCTAHTARRACRAPAQGYLVYSYRKKLKAELVGRSQEEIKALRAAGEEVTDTYQARGWARCAGAGPCLRGASRDMISLFGHACMRARARAHTHTRTHTHTTHTQHTHTQRTQHTHVRTRAPNTNTTNTHTQTQTQIPEVAFTGDTSGALFEDPNTPADLYKAKLLIVELTFVDETVSFEQVRAQAEAVRSCLMCG